MEEQLLCTIELSMLSARGCRFIKLKLGRQCFLSSYTLRYAPF